MSTIKGALRHSREGGVGKKRDSEGGKDGEFRGSKDIFLEL